MKKIYFFKFKNIFNLQCLIWYLLGLHRYTFLVYKQPEELHCDEPFISNRLYPHILDMHSPRKQELFCLSRDFYRTREGRPLFSIRKFAAKYNLGQPVAGNLFQTQYDDYVPTLQKQLGIIPQ